MKTFLSRSLLIGALLCLVAFFSFTWNYKYDQSSKERQSASIHLGLSFSPWFTFDRHVTDPNGSFHSGMFIHPISWSTGALILFFLLLRVRARLNHRYASTLPPADAGLTTPQLPPTHS